MLFKEVVKLINEQIKKKMYATNLFLSMSSCCYANSLDGVGDFLFEHEIHECNTDK
ncbi:hypothetical protein ACISOL_07810 [Campylobacter jejuni]